MDAQKMFCTVFIIACLLISGAGSIHAQPEINIPAMVDAIYRAEGSERAVKPFGILSVPCNSYAECRKICTNTVRNNIRRWKNAGSPGNYIDFLGNRYCPPSAHELNRNWVRNVRAIYRQITGE